MTLSCRPHGIKLILRVKLVFCTRARCGFILVACRAERLRPKDPAVSTVYACTRFMSSLRRTGPFERVPESLRDGTGGLVCDNGLVGSCCFGGLAREAILFFPCSSVPDVNEESLWLILYSTWLDVLPCELLV